MKLFEQRDGDLKSRKKNQNLSTEIKWKGMLKIPLYDVIF